MTMAEALLQVSNLKKYFKTSRGNLHAVDDLTFDIEEGQTLGIVGESGCGKTTLGRTILNLETATSGSIRFKGQELVGFNAKKMRHLRPELQLIFQDPYSSLDPRQTVSQAIAEPILEYRLCKGSEIETRIGELMDLVGLDQRLYNSYPHELDGGRRQRIGIARALSLDPSFIVCDEPVSALDVSIQAQILNLLMDLQEKKGLTYAFITHDLSVVKHISTDIAVMYLGQIVEKARSDELFLNPLHPYTRALLDAIPVPDLSYRGKKRVIIHGEVKSPIEPGIGCRFAPRCPFAEEECSVQKQELKWMDDDHVVACRRAEHLKGG
jgi:oligopeptide/dipeptide ABC transporter ATP-binding protein